MVRNYSNQYLLDNTCLNTECQMLFFQKMKELLHVVNGIIKPAVWECGCFLRPTTPTLNSFCSLTDSFLQVIA